MSLFKSNKTTISLYQKECRKLERERNELFAQLNAIQNYKQQYEDLMEEVKKLKNRYNNIIHETEALSAEYKKKLEKLTK